MPLRRERCAQIGTCYVMPSNKEPELEFLDWKENVKADIREDVNTELSQ